MNSGVEHSLIRFCSDEEIFGDPYTNMDEFIMKEEAYDAAQAAKAALKAAESAKESFVDANEAILDETFLWAGAPEWTPDKPWTMDTKTLSEEFVEYRRLRLLSKTDASVASTEALKAAKSAKKAAKRAKKAVKKALRKNPQYEAVADLLAKAILLGADRIMLNRVYNDLKKE